MKRLYSLALQFTLRTSLAAKVEMVVDFMVDVMVKADP